MNLIKNYSQNFSLPKREKKLIKYIIIHYTGMKKEELAIKRLCDPKSKVSSHYFLKKNGEIINFIPDLYTAWHAGNSCWNKINSLNRFSIGIEISNPGHDFYYSNFSLKQIKALERLLKLLMKNYKISIKNVLGHSDIAPNRKKDPGEKFPWKILFKKGFINWHKLVEKKMRIHRGKKLSLIEEKIFLKNLYKFGYCRIKKENSLKNKIYLTKAFQRRFRQGLVNGKIDKECFLISKSLIKTNNYT